MRRRVIAAAVLALIAIAVPATMAYEAAHSRAGDGAVIALRERALAYEDIHGALPEALDAVDTTILGLLPGPTVRYRSADDDCTIEYSAWPLGPRWGLTCRSDAWQGFSS